MRAHIDSGSSTITKPLLAGKVEDRSQLHSLKFPVGLTQKIDGLRCLMINGHAVSRTFKPLPNKHIRETLERYCPNGMDMEITSGATFQESTGNVMREDGVENFHVWVIDYVSTTLNEPYSVRIEKAKTYAQDHWRGVPNKVPFTWQILLPTTVYDVKAIDNFEALTLAQGHEGVMIRDMGAGYKCGRSTFNEGILLKLKLFEDAEAVVVGVEELYHNANEAQKDAFGRTKRSTAQDNLVGTKTLGALVVKGMGGDYDGVQFKVGTGFNQAQRQQLWGKNLKGKIVKFKYFPTGVKDAPRFPVFLGFRDKDDM